MSDLELLVAIMIVIVLVVIWAVYRRQNSKEVTARATSMASSGYKGKKALVIVSTIFYLDTFLGVASSILLVLLVAFSGYLFGSPLGELSKSAISDPIIVGLLLLLFSTSILTFVTARGIQNQRPWAKNIGYILALIKLFAFPIGTVVGIVVFYFLNQATKTGMFD